MKLLSTFWIIVACVATTALCPAQQDDDSRYRNTPINTNGYGGFGRGGGYGGYGGGHASTAAEGFQRGMADVIRSRGAANMMNSRAAINYTEAESNQIKNRMQATETYFDMRAVNKQAREAERGPRPTAEDAARYARERAPSRLSASQLDPLSGSINWPPILRDDIYKPYRDTLQSMYNQRAKNGTLTMAEMQEVQTAAASIEELMKENIDNYPPQAYVETKKVVSGLSREAQY